MSGTAELMWRWADTTPDAPALREGEHVAFRGDGSNAIIGEFYDETGLLVTHAYRIWVDAELIEDGAV